eukprot:g953.t1
MKMKSQPRGKRRRRQKRPTQIVRSGLVYVMIPCCGETFAEVKWTFDNFRRSKMANEALRRRLIVFIFLDRQKDYPAKDTPTCAAIKSCLGITSESIPTEKHGCRVYNGDIEGVPFFFFIKGEGLIGGKRYSQLLFSTVAEEFRLRASQQHQPHAILFLDCDMRTDGYSVQLLMDELQRRSHCGGVTGLILVGNYHWTNLVTSLQYFEYFYEHTTVRAADSTFGTVTLLPGAFAVLRYDAWRLSLLKYSRVPSPDDIVAVNELDLGEDRYLTTNLLINGFSTFYCESAESATGA